MSKIAIVDADLLDTSRNHRFPNLACMKIAGWHKAKGDEVKLVLNWSDTLYQGDLLTAAPSQTYISKVFTDTHMKDGWQDIPNLQYGGTGFFFDKAPKLPEEIEHSKPDYHLYDEWVSKEILDAKNKDDKRTSLKYYTDFSVGFTTRGCIRQCSFCVNMHSKKVVRHSLVSEFLDLKRPGISLWDDNILAFPQWKEVFEELQATGKPWEYKQGLDFRLLTPEKARALGEANYNGDYIFAFDNIADRETIEKHLNEMWKPYIGNSHKTKFYVFCGFDREEKYDEVFWIQDMHDAFERCKILFSYKCYPYIMRHANSYNGKYSWFYQTLSTWCNQINVVEYKDFTEVYQRRTKPTPLFDEMMKLDWFQYGAKMMFKPDHIVKEKQWQEALIKEQDSLF